MKESKEDIDALKREAALLAKEEARKRLETTKVIEEEEQESLEKALSKIESEEERKQIFEEAKQRVMEKAAERIEEEQVAEENIAEKKRRAVEEAKKRAKEIAAQKAMESEGKTEEEKAKAKAAAAAKAKAAALAKKKAMGSGGATEEEKAKAKAAAAAKAKAAALAKKKAMGSGGATEEEKAKAIAAAKAKAAAAAKARANGKTDESGAEELVKPSLNQPYLDWYVQVISAKLGEGALEDSYINSLSKDVPTLVIKLEHYYDVMELLKNHKELAFHYMSELHATDFVTHMEVYVHLFSYEKKQSVAAKVKLDRDAPKAPSIVPLWCGADWPEREAYDLLGVMFEGHPNLKRIMMPDDWVGHPLRKDYEPYDIEL